MTTLDLTPYWDANEDWTGFLLLIVPVERLPAPSSQLARLVTEHIESDSALYDLVTVASSPGPDAFADSADWSTALHSSLVEGAMPQRHLLAPRAMLAIVVVGEDDGHIKQLALELREWDSFKRLGVRFFGCKVLPDPQHGGVAMATVRGIADVATKILTLHERQPDLAIDESTFLAEAARLTERGLIVPIRAASPSPVTLENTSGSAQPHTPPAPVRSSPVRPVTLAPQAPRAPLSWAPQEPVFHRGEEMVMVDGRSPLKRLREPAPTDAESIDWLSQVTDAVSLAYLIFVPDEQSSRSKASRGYRRTALSLDQLLGTVVGDALTGRPIRVAVEVLTAVSPLRKHGILRPAGELAGNDLPRMPTELFDHSGTVDALLGAAQRTAFAFRARRVQVVSLHYFFLSGLALAEADTAGQDWDRLLHFARATWVEIGPAKPVDNDPLAANLSRLPDISPSPYGFHVVSDSCDVPALVRDQSSALYLYRPQAPVVDPDTTEKTPHRWWTRLNARLTGR